MATLINETTTSQCTAILEHLESGNSITALEALHRFGCFRLSGRIYDLKNKGHKITKTMVATLSDGKKKHVASYRLEPANKAA